MASFAFGFWCQAAICMDGFSFLCHRQKRTAFYAPIALSQMQTSRKSAGKSFCCVCAGLHPSRLQVPACLENASSRGQWTQHTALDQIQSSNGGWIETLGPNGAISRMAPPVPDFMGPFRKEAPSVQGGHRCMQFRTLLFSEPVVSERRISGLIYFKLLEYISI